MVFKTIQRDRQDEKNTMIGFMGPFHDDDYLALLTSKAIFLEISETVEREILWVF